MMSQRERSVLMSAIKSDSREPAHGEGMDEVGPGGQAPSSGCGVEGYWNSSADGPYSAGTEDSVRRR